MVRMAVYLLISILLITFLRMVMGMIFSSMKQMMNQPGPAASGAGVPRQRPPTTASGELKRDPVCGTFVPASTSLQRISGGETYYFCSAACRDKHAA